MFNNCLNPRSHDRKEVVTCNENRVSSIGKLINQFTCPEQRRRTSSPINLLQRARTCPERSRRKNNKKMQNKANLKNGEMRICACNRGGYGNLIAFSRPKNKAKQSQFTCLDEVPMLLSGRRRKPNFSPKLALFSPILALLFNDYGYKLLADVRKEAK
jgi:hypothetical protein